MKQYSIILVFCAVLTGLWAAGPQDDRRGDEPRIILYEHADYRGASLILHPGDRIENFSGQRFSNGTNLNDSVSSIRVEGGAELYVYANAGFHGAVMRVTENVRDLTGRLLADNSRDNWNDRISSLKVEGGGEHRRPAPIREADCDVIIRRVYQDLLGRAPDAGGLRNYRGLMIDQGWTEQMVRDHLRHGDEFRRERVDQIIRRAYLDVLGREVDASGLNQYRKAIIDKGWTEGDVRDDLRRSAEYKNRAKTKR
ncbi:MAG TPA: peptidase inhibitor family I36 protein [Lacunisphaera sp.]|jgi:hypothetical protein